MTKFKNVSSSKNEAKRAKKRRQGENQGMQAAQKGPSFLDLQLISGVNVEGASSYFTGSSFGYVMGAMAAGFLYDRLSNKLLLMCIPLTLASMIIGVTPWCKSYILMLLAHIAGSFQCAIPDTTFTTDQLHIWQEKSDTALLLISFAYSLGGVIAPLYTEPFLAPIVNNRAPSNASNTSLHQTTSLPIPQPESQLHFAYLITGIIGIVSAVPFYYLSVNKCCESKRTPEKRKPEDLNFPQRRLSLKPYIALTAVISAFVFFYNMVEDSFNFFLSMFVVSELSWSKESGAMINSLYWGIGVLSKLIMAFLLRRVDLGKILLSCCFGMVTSLVGFVLASHFHINILIWVSASCFSLSQAPIFNGCCAWANSNLLRMDGKVTSATMAFTSLGSMSGPLLLGFAMDKLSLMVFPYVLLMESAMCLGIFLFMIFFLKPFVTSHYGPPKDQGSKNREKDREESKKMMCEMNDLDAEEIEIEIQNGNVMM